MNISASTIDDIPLIQEGDDLAGIITQRFDIQDNDVVVIASTIVSKAEGRYIILDDITPSEHAIKLGEKNGKDPRMYQAVLNEAKEVLVEIPFMLVEMPNGHICINAGIDDSNIEDGRLGILPENADASARQIRDDILAQTGCKVSVIITDTNGRAFRVGQTGVAVGISGMLPTYDWRGMSDLFGTILEVTEEAIADEIAAFANLLMGEGNGGTPVAIVRGLNLFSESDGIGALHRVHESDVVRNSLMQAK
ncbi:MAG: coenzyme F420-0:L-glutamate ligase [Methanosarcinales archaeon]|nr:coenzyme F420-0:L-glutamate ligase [Methanosarcinales archaeon]